MSWSRILAGLGLLALAVVPLMGFRVSFFFYLMMWICMASSLNIIYGFTGYLPFGYVAFYGIGAYVSAMLVTRLGVPMPLAILAGGGAGVALALIFTPTLRLRGIYFAIVNFALAESLRILIANSPEEITGGSFGISLAKAYDPLTSYYFMFALMIVSFVTMWLLSGSKLGIALKAIKGNPEVAEALGVDTARSRLYAWLIAAFFPALAGGIDAWHTAVIDPATAFNVLITTRSIVYPLLGGLGTIMGPVVGTLLLYVVDDVIWGMFPLLNLMILGVIMAFLITMIPDGVVGILLRRYIKLRKVLF